jgi:hypothetical protein
MTDIASGHDASLCHRCVLFGSSRRKDTRYSVISGVNVPRMKG